MVILNDVKDLIDILSEILHVVQDDSVIRRQMVER